MQSLPLNTSCLFSILLNDDIVDIENPDGICLFTFLWMKFQDYFYIHQAFLLNIQDFTFSYVFMKFTFLFNCKRMKAIHRDV